MLQNTPNHLQLLRRLVLLSVFTFFISSRKTILLFSFLVFFFFLACISTPLLTTDFKLATIQIIFKDSTKVVIEPGSAQVLPYLPLGARSGEGVK